jgi:hypothetical protein
MFAWFNFGGTHEDREKQFKAIFTDLKDKTRKSDGAKIAINFCEDCIKEYQEWFEFNDKRWSLYQGAIIVGGAVATLAGAVTLPRRGGQNCIITAGFEPFRRQSSQLQRAS